MRQLVLELADPAQYPITPFSRDDDYLPVQLSSSNQSEDTDLQMINERPDSPLRENNVGGFGRQAQVIYLLDRVLSTCNDMDETSTISTLELLDSELRDLLTVTMGEYRGPGSHCGANATGLR